MTQEYSLGLDEIMRELNLGRATLKFILDRFSNHLSFKRLEGRPMYSPETLTVLIRIKDLMDNGLLPSQIDEALVTPSKTPDLPVQEEPDIRMSKDALGFIQDLFQDIKGHQSRIAKAHEKRAEAEERKAVAIEKRAEAEEKKAQAMNNIAAALQEMSQHRGADNQSMEIAGQAAQAIAMNEIEAVAPKSDTIVDPDTDLDADLLDEDLLDTPQEDEVFDLDSDVADSDLEEIFNHPQAEKDRLDTEELEDSEEDAIDLVDLSMLLDEPESPSEDMDDLTRLIDTVSQLGPDPSSELDDLETLLDNEENLPEVDDLSSLVDQAPVVPEETLDDLSLLVNQETATAETDLDDLSMLVDEPRPQDSDSQDIDDLSALVDTEGPSGNGPDAEDLDDLNLLLDSPESGEPSPGSLDDLSLLIEDHKGREAATSSDAPSDDLWALVEEGSQKSGTDETDSQDQSMDDLSALVDSHESPEQPTPAEPSLKPDITPDQDLGKYKATVMKIIISLKEKGMSAKETTDRLNQDEVPTLSGKAAWGEKAIAKIYGFIDSAK